MISAFLGSPQKGKFFLTKFQWEHKTVIRFPPVGSILNEAVPHKQNKISAKAMFCLRICAHLNCCSARLSQIIKFNLKFQWPNFIEQNSTTAATKQTPADLLNVDDGRCYSCYQRCLSDFFLNLFILHLVWTQQWQISPQIQEDCRKLEFIYWASVR